MKRDVREFYEQETVGAARSKEAKRAKRKRADGRLAQWIVGKAERMEANGNAAGAEQYRRFWRRCPSYAHLFPLPEKASSEGSR